MCPVPGTQPREGRDIITEFHFRRGAWEPDEPSTPSMATTHVVDGVDKPVFTEHVIRTMAAIGCPLVGFASP